MSKYTTPGVYIEEKNAFPSSIVQVETALPVFIGYTEKALHEQHGDLLNQPVKIGSMREYELFFGQAHPVKSIDVDVYETQSGLGMNTELIKPAFLLHYSLQFFFMNGGGECYIISVGDYTANSPYLASLEAGLTKAQNIIDATLIVIPDAINLPSADEYYSLHKAALAQCAAVGNRFLIMDVYLHYRASIDDTQALRDAELGEEGRKFGAAYYPAIITSIPFELPAEDAINIKVDKKLAGTLATLQHENAEHYLDVKQFLSQVTLLLPVSAAIAGLYVSVDNLKGVWKAPANISINGAIRPIVHLTDQEQAPLNVTANGKSINAIRSFPGQGILVWGARTLDGNSQDWRYVNVRRTVNMIEASIKIGMQTFVFEPNDANTWVSVKATIENFLINVWKQGGLQGAKPEEAFFVQVGLGQTMTAVDILEGRLNVTIGVAIIRPVEFIVITFSQQMQTSS